MTQKSEVRSHKVKDKKKSKRKYLRLYFLSFMISGVAQQQAASKNLSSLKRQPS
jgi:hypothetical protein